MIRRICTIVMLLASLTLFVGCALSQPIETALHSDLSNSGQGKSIVGAAQAKAYPLKTFDVDGNDRISDSEFMEIIDAWLRNQVDEETFLEGIDVWLFQAILLDEGDNGREITLGSRDVLALTLESNPSTGFRWEMAELTGSVLEVMGETKWQPYDSKSVLPGMGGWEIFHFRAKDSGQTALTLQYHRSWETGVAPLKTFTLKVVIR